MIDPGTGALPAGWAIPEVSHLAPAAIRLAPEARAAAFAYTPAQMFAPLLAAAPALRAEFEAGLRAYRHAVQGFIAEFVRTIRGLGGEPAVYVVALGVPAFTDWCTRTGHDPDTPGSRAIYAAIRADAAPAADIRSLAAALR